MDTGPGARGCRDARGRIRVRPAVSAVVADPTNFPILGEPLPVELANTRYSHATGIIDFLESPALIASWFAYAPAAAAAGLALPRRITEAQCEAIRAVRDVTHSILSSVLASGGTISSTDVTILNRFAARASSRPRLAGDEAAGLRSTLVYTGSRFDVLVAQVAAECIAFFAGPGLTQVRRCAHPDCAMFFVQQHRTRRFCHESCAHRLRQARYYLASVRPTSAAS